MNASPAVRHRRRMLAWAILALAALLLVVLSGSWVTPTFDGRHLLACIALAGLVLEAERTP